MSGDITKRLQDAMRERAGRDQAKDAEQRRVQDEAQRRQAALEGLKANFSGNICNIIEHARVNINREVSQQGYEIRQLPTGNIKAPVAGRVGYIVHSSRGGLVTRHLVFDLYESGEIHAHIGSADPANTIEKTSIDEFGISNAENIFAAFFEKVLSS